MVSYLRTKSRKGTVKRSALTKKPKHKKQNKTGGTKHTVASKGGSL